MISDNLSSGLADHAPNTCIVCTPEAFSQNEVRCPAKNIQHWIKERLLYFHLDLNILNLGKCQRGAMSCLSAALYIFFIL